MVLIVLHRQKHVELVQILIETFSGLKIILGLQSCASLNSINLLLPTRSCLVFLSLALFSSFAAEGSQRGRLGCALQQAALTLSVGNSPGESSFISPLFGNLMTIILNILLESTFPNQDSRSAGQSRDTKPSLGQMLMIQAVLPDNNRFYGPK